MRDRYALNEIPKRSSFRPLFFFSPWVTVRVKSAIVVKTEVPVLHYDGCGSASGYLSL